MRWGIHMFLLMSLLGCGPTGEMAGPPVTGTVYPSPRRATWMEEVRVTIPWTSRSTPAAKLAEVPLEVRTEPAPSGAGSVVIFKVPDNFWGGPQNFEIVEGANRVTGSLTVLGQTVFEQPEPEALAVIQPSVLIAVSNRKSQMAVCGSFRFRGGVNRFRWVADRAPVPVGWLG